MSERWKRRGSESVRNKKQVIQKTDYKRYHFSKRECLRYLAEGCLVIGILAYFFYRHIFAVCVMSPGIVFYMRNKKEELCRKRKSELAIQFKDALHSVNGSLQAGYSLENAFSEAYKDMAEYHGAESLIAKELFLIKTGIRNNQVLEDLVEDLAGRSGNEDIYDFAGVLRIGKSSGGNLNELFENSIAVIEEKVTVKQEIATLISSKRLESMIMCIIPFFIIFYVDITSKGYFDAMYNSLAGRIIMTICLFVYLAAYRMSQKIMEIGV